MKFYCITFRTKWGEQYNYTLQGNSVDEVLKQITLDPEWKPYSYSIVGG